MPQYRKLPVVIEAHRLPPADEEPNIELTMFLHAMKENWEMEHGGYVVIHTMEGDMMAKPGDWIIRGVKGEYYPCAHEVFTQTYEREWRSTMTNERWLELEKDHEKDLTEQEIADGWHFCWEWDGLLVNRYDTEGEGSACTCFSEVGTE